MCRTRISDDIYGNKNPVGRGNLFFATLNPTYIALKSSSSEDFLQKWQEAIDSGIEHLKERYDLIKNLKVKDMPFAMQWYTGSESLGQNDPIEEAIKHGSLSLGFCGLAETLIILFGKHHGELKEAQEFGLKVNKMIREATDKATEKYKLNFSCFATPAESTAGRFLKLIKKEFGEIKGITDKEYLTNSYHIPVGFGCSIKHKIDIEAPYHELNNAGHISYVELSSSPRFNPQAVEEIVNYMASKNMGYAGVNWTHNFCEDCKTEGFYEETCPKCGSSNIKITAIITGYLSQVNKFNKAKEAERKDRVSHGMKNSLK